MAEYISREKAREVVCDMCRWNGTSNCEECEHPVDDIPAADVAPVRHGKWIRMRSEPENTGDYLYECSVCHMSDIHNKAVAVSFCWNCGAKMEEDE